MDGMLITALVVGAAFGAFVAIPVWEWWKERK